MPPARKPRIDAAECPCHGQTLERLIRPAALAILARDGAQNAYRIVQQLAETPVFGGRKPNAAGVYRCLRTMEEEGSVTSTWEASDRGPDQRQYALTARGERCLRNWLETLREYRRAVDGLLTLGARAVGAHGRVARRAT